MELRAVANLFLLAPSPALLGPRTGRTTDLQPQSAHDVSVQIAAQLASQLAVLRALVRGAQQAGMAVGELALGTSEGQKVCFVWLPFGLFFFWLVFAFCDATFCLYTHFHNRTAAQKPRGARAAWCRGAGAGVWLRDRPRAVAVFQGAFHLGRFCAHISFLL